MKSYKIRVNGKSYDVTVEEVGGTGQEPPAARAPAAGTKPPAARPAAPAQAPASPAGAVPPAVAAKAGSAQVKASMPGTVIGLRAQAGQSLKAGDVILILEAMKMENEIVSPVDGVLTSFAVKEGASVAAGDLLATIG